MLHQPRGASRHQGAAHAPSLHVPVDIEQVHKSCRAEIRLVPQNHVDESDDAPLLFCDEERLACRVEIGIEPLGDFRPAIVGIAARPEEAGRHEGGVGLCPSGREDLRDAVGIGAQMRSHGHRSGR